MLFSRNFWLNGLTLLIAFVSRKGAAVLRERKAPARNETQGLRIDQMGNKETVIKPQVSVPEFAAARYSFNNILPPVLGHSRVGVTRVNIP